MENPDASQHSCQDPEGTLPDYALETVGEERRPHLIFSFPFLSTRSPPQFAVTHAEHIVSDYDLGWGA